MGASAVPYRTVASCPALQWVSIPSPSFMRASPFSPMARQTRISSSRISSAFAFRSSLTPELKEQDIATLIKLINFCINSVIVKRFSLKDFEHFADIMFGLEKGKIKVLWDIILENKKELQVNYIISKLDELTALSNDND